MQGSSARLCGLAVKLFRPGCALHARPSSQQSAPCSCSFPPPTPAVEPIFPPELRKRAPAELALRGPRCDWYRPLSLDSLLALKAQYPHAKLVVGNTGALLPRPAGLLKLPGGCRGLRGPAARLRRCG